MCRFRFRSERAKTLCVIGCVEYRGCRDHSRRVLFVMKKVSLRTRAKDVFSDLERFGVGEEAMRSLLRYKPTYFARLKLEAQSSKTEGSPDFLNDEAIGRLERLRELVLAVRERTTMPIGVKQYEELVVNEINRLRPGATHTLIFVPAPLESKRGGKVTDAVVRAASNGVSFRYYFPSQQAVSKYNIAFQATKDSKSSFLTVFAWLNELDKNVRMVMRSIYDCAVLADQEHWAEHKQVGNNCKSVLDKIKFLPLQIVPLGLNEKVVWISQPEKDSKPTMRKEILYFSGEFAHPYASDQTWRLVDYPFPADSLKDLLVFARDAKAQDEFMWKRVIPEAEVGDTRKGRKKK